jgi:GrpB-like predicted nucleotidyltransferase (UPF0157 family)
MAKLLSEMTGKELSQLFPIIIREHDPKYQERYENEKSVLEEIIGKDKIARINHYGSTYVPGLLAKPTIDILLEIVSETDVAMLISEMEKGGYIYSPQPKNPPPCVMFLKGYTPDGFKGQTFHIHLRYCGDWDELYFRDYLVSHKDVVSEYGQFKLKLKNKYEFDRDAYTEAKTDFIKRVSEIARNEMSGRYKIDIEHVKSGKMKSKEKI